MIINLLGNCSLLLLILSNAFYVILPDKSKVKKSPFTITILFFISTLPLITLIYAHINDSFSVENVFLNSSINKPLLYKIAGTWGNHEGSMLLWIFILNLFTMLFNTVTFKEIANEDAVKITTNNLQFTISISFTLFLLFTSSPFQEIIPVPKDGLGFNPLLQDVALSIHPTILYSGYVGFSVVFSYTMSSIIHDSLHSTWLYYCKLWSSITFILLTLGIALGSWWAYRELGWGGIWFWDPVENISLLPWLIICAIIHNCTNQNGNNYLLIWTTFLVFVAFISSLIGTFLIRSGLISSIHTFASSGERGVYLLIIITIITIFYFCTCIKAKDVFANNSSERKITRKTMFLILNNYIMLSIFLIILAGILYPIFTEIFFGNKISIGSNYYSTILSAIMIITLLMMILINTDNKKLKKKRALEYIFHLIYNTHFLLSSILFFLILAHQGFIASLLIMLGFWLMISSIQILTKSSQNRKKTSWNMTFAHGSVGAFIIAVTISQYNKTSFEKHLSLGEEININGYSIQFSEVNFIKRDNHDAIQGVFNIHNKNKKIAILYPENRLYRVEQSVNLESDTYHGMFSDIQLIMGYKKNDNTFAIKLYYTPFIQMVWVSIFMIIISIIYSLISGIKYKAKKVKLL